MSASSRTDLVNAAKKRAKEIQDHINSNPKSDTGMVKNAFQNDKIVALKVYELPTYLLRPNPDNGRFKVEMDLIRDDRKSKGLPLDLDPDNSADVDTIMKMIRGQFPMNTDRKNAYEKLKNNIYEVAQKTGTNGQEEPGLITFDGILVNGNRRFTVMDELAIGNKKTPGEPLKYNVLRVAILDESASQYDLWKNEAKEQISQESREEYDYVHSALEIKRGYEILLAKQLSDKKAKEEIAKTLYGRTVRDVDDYLNFLSISDLFLKQIKRPGEYKYIQDSGASGDEKGVVTILQEIAKQRDKYKKQGWDASQLQKWFKSVSLFCVLSKQKPIVTKNGKKEKLKFGHREYRIFQKKAMATEKTRERVLDDPVLSSIDLAKPTADEAYDFRAAIRRAENTYDIDETINNPNELLERAKDSLMKVITDLNGGHSKEMIKIINEKNGQEFIKNIKILINDIAKKASKK